jgi:hypothetical protein
MGVLVYLLIDTTRKLNTGNSIDIYDESYNLTLKILARLVRRITEIPPKLPKYPPKITEIPPKVTEIPLRFSTEGSHLLTYQILQTLIAI